MSDNCERSCRLGDIELVYWDSHHCTISRARSSSNWATSARNVHRLKGSGSSSYQTLLPRAAGEGVSTAQASKIPTEVCPNPGPPSPQVFFDISMFSDQKEIKDVDKDKDRDKDKSCIFLV